ncbi:hypothetical protein KUTeg_009446, partial [Tegillarca granosa]
MTKLPIGDGTFQADTKNEEKKVKEPKSDISDVLFIVLSQPNSYHRTRSEIFRKHFEDQLIEIDKEIRPQLILAHEEWDFPGVWTVFPLLPELSSRFGNKSWVFICEDETRINLKKLQKLLQKYDHTKELFLGHALRDSSPTIIHHFAFFDGKVQFDYPDFGAGILLIKIIKDTWGKTTKHIEYYSDKEDPSIPTVYLGIPNTERGWRQLYTYLFQFTYLHVYWTQINIFILYSSLKRLRKLLTCYDPKEVVHLGENMQLEIIIIMVVLAVLSGYIITSVLLLKFPIFHKRKQLKFYPKHISHRGGAGENLENTMTAFKHAYRLGTEMLELDCHITKDGEDLPLLNCSLSLDFQSTYSIVGGEDRKIPLLRDVFQEFPNLPINVDIKVNDDELIEKNPDIPLIFSMKRVMFTLFLFYSGLLPFIPLKESLLEIIMPNISDVLFIELFLGHALRDSSPTIIHHFAFFDGKVQFDYPDFGAGFLLSKSWPVDGFRADFSIDPKHEVAMLIWNDGKGLTLTDIAELCTDNIKDNCATWYPMKFPDCGPPIKEEDLFVGVKTCEKFHKERIKIIKDTWGKTTKHIEYYSDKEDPSIPTVDLGIPNTERGHCGKTMAMIKRFYNHPDLSKYPWYLIADDDTLIKMETVFTYLHVYWTQINIFILYSSLKRLRKLLTCYDPKEVVHLGEKYGYSVAKKNWGYNYITGGGGMIFSREAIRLLVDKGMVECGQVDSPDDMTLGMRFKHLGVPLVHSPYFHQ